MEIVKAVEEGSAFSPGADGAHSELGEFEFSAEGVSPGWRWSSTQAAVARGALLLPKLLGDEESGDGVIGIVKSGRKVSTPSGQSTPSGRALVDEEA